MGREQLNSSKWGLGNMGNRHNTKSHSRTQGLPDPSVFGAPSGENRMHTRGQGHDQHKHVDEGPAHMGPHGRRAGIAETNAGCGRQRLHAPACLPTDSKSPTNAQMHKGQKKPRGNEPNRRPPTSRWAHMKQGGHKLWRPHPID